MAKTALLSQNVPKFELFENNDELFNIYQGFLMNFDLVPILTDYANQKKGGMKLEKKSSLKLLSQSQPNLAEIILGWPPSKIVSGNSDLRPKWPPQSNII